MDATVEPRTTLPADAARATLIGRAWLPGPSGGPTPVLLSKGELLDLAGVAPTISALLELPDPLAAVRAAPRKALGHLDTALASAPDLKNLHLLAPVRPAGGQGRRRDVRREHARARDRGTGARQPGGRAGGARPGDGDRRRRPLEGQARLAAGDAAQEAAARAEDVVAVPRGRHRPRRRDLHQGAAAVLARHWHRASACIRARPGTIPSRRSSS